MLSSGVMVFFIWAMFKKSNFEEELANKYLGHMPMQQIKQLAGEHPYAGVSQ
jgi:hypothetical protein